MTYGEKIIRFLNNLSPDMDLPDDIRVMNPYLSKEVKETVSSFYRKFFPDDNPRTFLIGINPGRFGAGITGISFTDPIRLEEVCHIFNPFDKKQEISSVFMHKIIRAFGGPEKFYRRFYVTAVCPLGFIRKGKNLNYYDLKELQQTVIPFIVATLQEQLEFGANRKTAYCIGEGKNYRFLKKLNESHDFFEKIIPLPHPRFVMQYRYKEIEEYINYYLKRLRM
ncbi:MAG TPA: DUF4918 family protein [Bacteroidetes bacterium]|nr:DUF4918 family protein [Bacteroidota bacterium]